MESRKPQQTRAPLCDGARRRCLDQQVRPAPLSRRTGRQPAQRRVAPGGRGPGRAPAVRATRRARAPPLLHRLRLADRPRQRRPERRAPRGGRLCGSPPGDCGSVGVELARGGDGGGAALPGVRDGLRRPKHGAPALPHGGARARLFPARAADAQGADGASDGARRGGRRAPAVAPARRPDWPRPRHHRLPRPRLGQRRHLVAGRHQRHRHQRGARHHHKPGRRRAVPLPGRRRQLRRRRCRLGAVAAAVRCSGAPPHAAARRQPHARPPLARRREPSKRRRPRLHGHRDKGGARALRGALPRLARAATSPLPRPLVRRLLTGRGRRRGLPCEPRARGGCSRPTLPHTPLAGATECDLESGVARLHLPPSVFARGRARHRSPASAARGIGRSLFTARAEASRSPAGNV
uniref:Uncharacterized protein n=1 Tax=Emiliania huxleyi (strain CCMP1516) TaxID=280463 RepID=A0A0D3KBI8_EMIH1